MFVCVCLEVMSGVNGREKVPSFLTITLVVARIDYPQTKFLIQGVLFEFQTVNFNWGIWRYIWYIAPWLRMLHFQLMQPTRQDVTIDF